ncbi:MAG: GNAT family N-acetyltransferase [Syntrophaceae bacterium]|nr:GNAT family N-acetyltransferase [Syntrophaceae bacterium]
MNIREATLEDDKELQDLQAKCPQGKTLIVSLVNTPDFFARAKAYESYRVYVACDDHRIISSAACGMRQAFIKGSLRRVGYEFQYFTSPDYRGKGIAKQLHKQIVDYLTQQGAVLSYLLVMEGNLPAMRLFASLGFEHHCALVMPGLAIYKEMKVAHEEKMWCLIPIGFKDPDHLTMLLRYLNNRALARGVEQIFCIGERNHPFLTRCMKEFVRFDTNMHLYVKSLQQHVSLSDAPVYVNGIDL